MLHRDEDFEEWELAEIAKDYIQLHLRNPDDKICFVPYKDIPSGQTKHVKFVYEEATGWMYVDNSQHS